MVTSPPSPPSPPPSCSESLLAATLRLVRSVVLRLLPVLLLSCSAPAPGHSGLSVKGTTEMEWRGFPEDFQGEEPGVAEEDVGRDSMKGVTVMVVSFLSCLSWLCSNERD